MVQLKFYYLDVRLGYKIIELMEHKAKELGYDIQFKLQTKPIQEIPKDYDAYLIHISDCSKQMVQELRKENPWCKIYGVFRGGGIEDGYGFDADYGILTGYSIEQILTNAVDNFTKKTDLEQITNS